MKITLCLGLALLAVPASGLAADLRFVGTARPVDGGEALYQETHRVSGSCEQGVFVPGEHSVVYTRDDGSQFATKDLSYDQSALRPTVEFRQPDFSEVIRITNQEGETLKVIWQSPSGATDASSLAITPSLVADAGFNNLVRQSWVRVIHNGQSVGFDMLAPTRGESYGFTLEPADDDRIDARHLVRIRPASTLMRFLVDPILLGYNADGLLTHYLGLTNIRKNDDANYTAHISYAIEATPECKMIP